MFWAIYMTFTCDQFVVKVNVLGLQILIQKELENKYAFQYAFFLEGGGTSIPKEVHPTSGCTLPQMHPLGCTPLSHCIVGCMHPPWTDKRM